MNTGGIVSSISKRSKDSKEPRYRDGRSARQQDHLTELDISDFGLIKNGTTRIPAATSASISLSTQIDNLPCNLAQHDIHTPESRLSASVTSSISPFSSGKSNGLDPARQGDTEYRQTRAKAGFDEQSADEKEGQAEQYYAEKEPRWVVPVLCRPAYPRPRRIMLRSRSSDRLLSRPSAHPTPRVVLLKVYEVRLHPDRLDQGKLSTRIRAPLGIDLDGYARGHAEPSFVGRVHQRGFRRRVISEFCRGGPKFFDSTCVEASISPPCSTVRHVDEKGWKGIQARSSGVEIHHDPYRMSVESMCSQAGEHV